MPAYRLQTTMRFTDGRDGFAIDNIDIETTDIESALALAQEWRPEASGLAVDVLMLLSPEGTVLWSLRCIGEP